MTVGALVVAAWALALCGTFAVALWRSFGGRGAAVVDRQPMRMALLRPCAGAEPWLEANLTSLDPAALGPGAVVVFGVASASDPAWPVCAAAAETLRGRGVDARALVTGAQAPNMKSAQLAAMAAAIGEVEVIVNADSDVDLGSVDWGAWLSPFRASTRLGARWVPPVEAPGLTLGDRASEALLAGSLHAFPILAGLDPGGLVGKLVALNAEALKRVGGFEALTHHLGEDMELARRLRAAGYAVSAMPGVARARVSGRSLAAVRARYARWVMVIRAQRPALLWSYPALFFASALVVPLLSGLALGCRGPLGAGLGALALGLATLRLALGARARALAGHPWGLVGLVVDWGLSEALLAAAWASALGPREVVWRGRRLQIDAAGALRGASARAEGAAGREA